MAAITRCAAFILCLVLLGCSGLKIVKSPHRPLKFKKIHEFQYNEEVKKVCYSSIDKTTYVLTENSQNVVIFSKSKKMNTVGGLGFESSNFNRLTDITLSQDSKLLCLDSFQKKIKKFDHDGKYIASYDLNDVSEPTLLTTNNSGEIFVFDKIKNQLTAFQDLTNNESFNFGMFQLDQPHTMSCNNDNLWVVEKNNDVTIVFNTLGQYEKEINGYNSLAVQDYVILKKKYQLIDTEDQKIIYSSVDPIKDFWVYDHKICIVTGKNMIVVGELSYEKN